MKRKILFLFIIIILIGAKFSFADMNIAIQDTVLPPPNDFNASGENGCVNLSWDEPSQGNYNLIGYYLYRSDPGRYVYLDNTQNTYCDYMVYTGIEYTYWATAVYSEGESVNSNVDTATSYIPSCFYETFYEDWHLTGWRAVPSSPNNWEWDSDCEAAKLNWSPSVTNYDMSLISPEIWIPYGATFISLNVNMYIHDYATDFGEVMEIWIINGGQETLIFEWDLDYNGDWGSPGGTIWEYCDMSQYEGETIQIKFRSHGGDTYNFNYWYIYDVTVGYAWVPSYYATLVVTATDSSGNPVEGVTVNAVSTQWDLYYNAYTNENGEFTIFPMIPGDYWFTYYISYFCPIVEVVNIPSSSTLNFEMSSLSTMSISPTCIDTIMAPDDSIVVYLTIQNYRDVPIHWFADIVNSDLNNANNTVFINTSNSKDIEMNLKRKASSSFYSNDSLFCLSTTTTHGIIAPGQSFDWRLLLDTTGQTPGTVLEFDVVFTSDPNVGTIIVPVTVTIIEEGIDDIPDISTKLNQNYPNPFSTFTTISFNLTVPMIIGKQTRINIYNIKGQLVRYFAIRNPQSELTKVVWDGKDENGDTVSSGLYFYQLKIDNKIIDTKKCLILR